MQVQTDSEEKLDILMADVRQSADFGHQGLFGILHSGEFGVDRHTAMPVATERREGGRKEGGGKGGEEKWREGGR